MTASMTFPSGREELDQLMTGIVDLAAQRAAGTLELSASERLNWGLNQSGVFSATITVQTQSGNIDATLVPSAPAFSAPAA